MRTDTRTLEEKIAGCDAKRVVSTIEQQPSRPRAKPAAYGANKPRRSQLRRSRSVAPCDPTAGRYNRSRLAGAPRDSQRSWLAGS
jgi:hypothetical protein